MYGINVRAIFTSYLFTVQYNVATHDSQLFPVISRDIVGSFALDTITKNYDYKHCKNFSLTFFQVPSVTWERVCLFERFILQLRSIKRPSILTCTDIEQKTMVAGVSRSSRAIIFHWLIIFLRSLPNYILICYIL